MMDLKRVAEVAAAECERQKVGLSRYILLLQAYSYAEVMPNLSERQVRVLAGIIEPANERGYRQVPVTFPDLLDNGSPPDTIPHAMARLCEQIPDIKREPYVLAPGRSYQVSRVWWWVRSLLAIHPFEDGNGRLAWILHNYLYGMMDYPAPLPDYFSASGRQ